MRIRTIKPEFWRSDDIARLRDPWDRLLFIGLWNCVDDNGVGRDSVAGITGDLFANDLEADPEGVLRRVSEGLGRLADLNLILRYEVAGKKLLYVTGWEHQKINRPSRARFPRPGVLTEGSLRPHEIAPIGTGNREQGTGIREQVTGSREQGTPQAALVSAAAWNSPDDPPVWNRP